MSLAQINPFDYFSDTNGDPLDQGYIYVGVANQDPVTNPIAIYYDAAMTIPAPQPLRTVAGYISNPIAPQTFFTNENYSVSVRDKNQIVLFYVANFSSIVSNTPFALQLAASNAWIAAFQADTQAWAANYRATNEAWAAAFQANLIQRYLSFNNRGNWATGTGYAIQDLVIQGSIAYICLIAHTSGVFATDLANGDWAIYQGATKSELGASNGSSLIGFQQIGSGSVLTTLNDYLDDVYAPFQFDIGGADKTSAIQKANDAIPSGGTLTIPNGNYTIGGSLSLRSDINIVCNGTLNTTGGGSINFIQLPTFTLTGADLTSLPVRGDTVLSITNTAGLPADLSQYYFSLNSSEVEIIRIGYVDPYYKNETNDIITPDLKLRVPIELNYTNAANLVIKFYKKLPKTSVQLRIQDDSTIQKNVVLCNGVSYKVWDVQIARNSVLATGSSFKYENCAFFTFMNCQIDGGQSDASDSYAFLNICSSFVLHFGCGYHDGTSITTKTERGYAARHGNHVGFYGCDFTGIDDHYGYNYVIRDMTFVTRGIGISGGSVYIENCHATGNFILMQIRNDTPYASGRLVIKNSTSKTSVLYAESLNNASYASKYKTWDSILIEDCVSYTNHTFNHAVRFSIFYPQNTNYVTDSLIIRNLKFQRTGDNIARCINSAGGASAQFNDIEINGLSIQVVGAEVTSNQVSTGLTAIKSITLKNYQGIDGFWTAPVINIDDKSVLGYTTLSSVGFLATTRFLINDSDITDKSTNYSSAVGQGAIYLTSNRIKGAQFFANSNLNNNIVAAFGNTPDASVTSLAFIGDLRDYQKNKPLRYLSTTFALGTLAVGAASAIQTSTVSGARVGDSVRSGFTTNANGLQINAWVSAVDTVKWYIWNPTANPSGSQTFANIGLNLTVLS